MKKLWLFLTVLFIMPAVLADITIETDQPVYNLGNKIRASASALYEADFEGLLKLTISCNGYKLQYYTTPVVLEANSRTAVDVPELTATSSMLGSCAILGDLMTNENLIVEEEGSNAFEVTHKLSVLPVNARITSLPSETIKIVGIVNEAFGNNVLKAKIKATLDNQTYETEAIDGKFDVSISLPKSIKSGSHQIEITASDAKNNIGDGLVGLEVIAVPNYIKLEVSSNNIKPGEKVSITSSLYDQADEIIYDGLGLEMVYGNEEKIFTKTVQSNEKIDYEFSQYAKPGNYLLTSTYKDLKAESLLNITTIREIKIKYQNQSVFIENIGNIPFVEEITLFLQNELQKFAITKKISVEPGKVLAFDLSKEVPGGIYNILVKAQKNVIEKLNESINNVASDEEILAENAVIEDNRPIYKKMASGFSSIGGRLVGADGLLTKNPLIAPLILAAIVLMVIVRYGRKPIMRLIKRDKKENKADKED